MRVNLIKSELFSRRLKNMTRKRQRRHTTLQKKFAGKKGKREVPIKVGRKTMRRDVVTPRKVIEVERTGKEKNIALALLRLQKSKKPHKILKVPTQDLDKAARIRGKRKKITISNLSGTKYI